MTLAAIAGSLVTLLILIVLWHKQGEDRRLAEQYGRMVGGYLRYGLPLAMIWIEGLLTGHWPGG